MFYIKVKRRYAEIKSFFFHTSLTLLHLSIVSQRVRQRSCADRELVSHISVPARQGGEEGKEEKRRKIMEQ